MIKENHFIERFLPSNSRIEDVPLYMIRLSARQRIRQESGAYKSKKYYAIKKSMNVLEQFSSILLKEEEDGHFTLILPGFYGFALLWT